MATLRNKRKIAAVLRETREGSRGSRGQIVLDPELTQEYISQVSEEIEGRVTKKLSKEFSKTESRILGALSNLDEFLLNPQVRTCSVAVQGTYGNANSENREPHGDRSSNDPYPEVGCLPHHSGQLNSPETETISHMVTENYPHSSIDHTIAGITSDIVISPEQCRTLVKGKEITLLGLSINFGFDKKNPIVKTSRDTSDDHRNECDGKCWITRDTFLPHMQTTTLNVTLENGKVFSDSGLFLPCALEELRCETSSLDPYVYIWDYPDNCAISIIRTEEVNVVKQGKKYYVISAADSSSKFVSEVKNNPQKHCGKLTSIYPTNYDSLYMDRLSESFDMDTGRNLSRDQNPATKFSKILGPKKKSDFSQFYAHNPKIEGTQKSQTADHDN